MISTCLQYLHKPTFVIKMNFSQNRWSDERRLEWLRKLRFACGQTISAIDEETRRYGV